MFKKIIFSILILLNAYRVFSAADTLEIKNQFRAFDSISSLYPDKAIELGKQIEKQLSDNIPQKFHLKLFAKMGKTYARLSDVKNADIYLNKILNAVADRPLDLWFKGEVYQSKSILSANSGDFQKAIDYLLKAEHYYEQSKYNYTKWELKQNLAILYAQTGNLNKGLEAFLEIARYHASLPQNRTALGDTYSNIGVVFNMMNQPDSAIKYYQNAFTILSEHGNSQGLAMLLNNIAAIKLKQKKGDEGISYLNRSLEMMRTTGDKKGLIMALNNIAEVLIELKKPQDALKYAKEAYTLASEGKLFYELTGANSILASISYELNDTRNAYLYSKRYAALNDSLKSSESIKQIAEMEAKYETSNKQKEIELLKKDNELQSLQNSRNKTIILSLVAGSLILAGMFFMIFRQYREKKKVNAQLEMKNQIIEEKQKEILDSIHYAQRIQRSLLPTEKYISKVLKKQA